MDSALDVESWSIQKLHPRFGARLEGHRMGLSLPHSLRQEIVRAVHHYGVVVLPGQHLSDDEIYDFGDSIGCIHGKDNIMRMGKGGVFPLTNLDESGNILPPTNKALRLNDANELWHTDSTYVYPGATFSMLSARTIPPVGGETEYCDTRCAYEDLPAEQKASLAELVATHSLIHSRSFTGFNYWTDEERRALPPIDRPLVRFHKESGRNALCLAAHIAELKPLPHDEAQRLVWSLIDAATKPESVYIHRWSLGDFLIWDNRCTMHRGRPYDQRNHGRDMRTLRLDDEDELKTLGAKKSAAAVY